MHNHKYSRVRTFFVLVCTVLCIVLCLVALYKTKTNDTADVAAVGKDWDNNISGCIAAWHDTPSNSAAKKELLRRFGDYHETGRIDTDGNWKLG